MSSSRVMSWSAWGTRTAYSPASSSGPLSPCWPRFARRPREGAGLDLITARLATAARAATIRSGDVLVAPKPRPDRPPGPAALLTWSLLPDEQRGACQPSAAGHYRGCERMRAGVRAANSRDHPIDGEDCLSGVRAARSSRIIGVGHVVVVHGGR